MKWLPGLALFCLAAVPLSAADAASADVRTAHTLAYTSQLPMPEWAEVDHLTVDQAGHITGVTGTSRLPRKSAEQLALLWRAQTFGFHYSSGCHLPGFAVRFYQDHHLLAEETICFTCGSILFRHTDVLAHLTSPGWQGFDRRTPAAGHLLVFLKNLFPQTFPTTS